MPRPIALPAAAAPAARPTDGSLRQMLAPRIPARVLPLGAPAIDACLPGGGLPIGALHMVEPAAGAEAQYGAVGAAFIASLAARLADARPCLWVATRCDLYAPGLAAHGLDPARLILARAADDAAALAAMEAGLRGGAFATVVGEVGTLGRLAARRLQLACLRAGSTGLVLRRWPFGRPAQARETPSAVTSWRIAPAPSDATFREPGRPRWRLELLHARGGTGLEGDWIVEATEGDTAGPVRVVGELADPAAAPQRRRAAG